MHSIMQQANKAWLMFQINDSLQLSLKNDIPLNGLINLRRQ